MDETVKETKRTEFPGFGELLSESLGIYKKSVGKLLALSFISLVSVPAMIAGSVAIFIISQAPFVEYKPLNLLLLIPLGILAFLFFDAIVLWFHSSIVKLIGDIDSNAPTGIKTAFSKTKSKIVPLMVVTFTSALIVICGFFLFLIPAILFSVWFSLMTFVVIFENERGINALMRSREYVRGYAFWIFIYQILLQILIAVVGFIPSYLLNSLDYKTASTIISWIFQIATFPVVMIFTYLMYKHLKEMKGDITETVSKKSKTWYKLGMIAGIVLPILIGGFLISIAATAFQNLRQSLPSPTPGVYEYEEVIDELPENGTI